MLLELRAENYAVIDHAIAGFGPGLNLLTGETGAGKSILIDALALLLGGKASSDVVRHGAEKAVVGCVFEMTPGAAAVLEANGIDAEARTRFCCGGRLAANGKGRVFVNNQPATVGVLRQLRRSWRWCTRRARRWARSTRRSSGCCWIASAASGRRHVAAAFAAWRATSDKLEELQSASRTGCAWPTCGASRAKRSSRRS